MIYLNEMLVIFLVYILLTLSFSILTEFTGLLSFLPVAVFGATAFAYPYILNLTGLHLATIPILITGSLLTGLLIGIATYEYNSNFITALTFGLIASHTTIALSPEAYFPIMLTMLIFTGLTIFITFLIHHLTNAPYGDNLKLIKEDELSAQLMGKSVTNLKLTSMVLSSLLAGAGGIIFSIGYTSKYTLNPFMYSILFLTVIIFSGQHILGSLAGVLVIGVLPELLNLTNLAGAQLTAVKEIIFAIVLMCFLVLKPDGLFTSAKLTIKQPKLTSIVIKLKKETSRQKASKIAHKKNLTKKEKLKQQRLQEIAEKLEQKHQIREAKRKEKERCKLEKRLLKEKRQREKMLAQKKSYDELDKFEDKIRKEELKRETAMEKSIQGETLFEKGVRVLQQQREKAVKYIKKKR